MRHSHLLSSALVLENTNILCGRYVMRWRQSSLYDTVPSEIQGQYCCFAHMKENEQRKCNHSANPHSYQGAHSVNNQSQIKRKAWFKKVTLCYS